MYKLLLSIFLVAEVTGKCYVGFQEVANTRTLYTNCVGSTSKELMTLRNIEPFGQIKLLDLHSFSGSFEEESLSAFPKIETLQIHESLYGNLTKNVLKKCSFINRIIFRNNKHDVIDNEMFQELSKLKHVIINQDNITAIENNLFKGLTDLETIIINSSYIQKIEESAFNDNKKLKILELHSNNITEIKENTFARLTNLQTLTLLNNNHLKSIDIESFSKLSSLENLGLPLEVLKKYDIEKLKKMLPKLKAFLVKTQEESCYKDFLKEVETKKINVILVTFAGEPFCINSN